MDSSTAVVTPDWVTRAVFYQIFPDRFAKSDSLESHPTSNRGTPTTTAGRLATRPGSGCQFDGVMNYLFAEAAIAFSAGHRVRRNTVEDRTTELTPGALMLTLPARSGAVLDASPASHDRA